MDTVGVIVITYNGEQFIIQQLDSIRKQTVCPDQVMIYDDFSTDNTLILVSEYIKKYHLSNWHIHCNKKNLGWTKNCQIALHECKTDFIFWCDQDDIWHPDKIKTMMSIMKRNEFLILYSNWTYIDTNGKCILRSSKQFNNKLIKVNCWNRIIPPMLGCSTCIKRPIIELFERVLPCEFDSPDWILFYLGISLNKLGFIDKALFKRRIHNSNVTTSITKLKRTWRFSYQKHKETIRVLTIQYKALNKIISVLERQKMLCYLTYIKTERDYLKSRLRLLLSHDFNLHYLVLSFRQNSFADFMNTLYKDLLYSLKIT